VQQIIDAHPEVPDLGEFARKVREAYSASISAGGTNLAFARTDWNRFQQELAQRVDFSTPKNRELMARYTYYVVERQTGTPPWLRTGGGT
jgi:hypothetical protein